MSSSDANPITAALRASRRALSLVAVAIAALLVVAAGGASAQTVRRSSILWGAVTGSQFSSEQSPWDINAVNRFSREDAGGKKESVIPLYQPFTDCSTSPCTPYAFPTPAFQNVRNYGGIPLVSWSSTAYNPNQPGSGNLSLTNLAKGRYDTQIRAWATAAKAWGHPFFLRFDWEMNGNWFAWGQTSSTTPAEYVAAWRHIHNIFTQVGATNATWVWCPNNGNQNGSLAGLASLYPGNAYVNWTCTDVYDFGASGGGGVGSWNTLAGPVYQALTHIAPSKPVMVGEFNANAVGGAQATWLAQTLKTIPRSYPKIHAVVLFDTDANGYSWELEKQAASRKAFASGIASTAYATNRFGKLPGGAVKAP